MPAASAPRPPSERVRGFVRHLRLNGFAVGPAETALALDILGRLGPSDPAAVRHALKVGLAGNREQWDRFDELFSAYWQGRGVRTATVLGGQGEQRARKSRPALWNRVLPREEGDGSAMPAAMASTSAASDEDGRTAGLHRIAADRTEKLVTADLRDLVAREDVAEAERVAERLAAAIRYRLSRRRRPSARGRVLDLRRTIRRNLAHGGEPFELMRRARPDRPVRIVVLLDVSGSMKLYSRYFLLFVRGLLSRWARADAFLFHTRLARVSEALTDKDPLRAMARLSLMTEGFGGGTRIAGAIADFNRAYAKQAIDSRTVVIVVSDGYDTEPPEALAVALAELKRRARRLVWLNPLLGWKGYEPVARGMAAALPFIDHFAAANTLEALAAIEPDLARL